MNSKLIEDFLKKSKVLDFLRFREAVDQVLGKRERNLIQLLYLTASRPSARVQVARECYCEFLDHTKDQVKSQPNRKITE